MINELKLTLFTAHIRDQVLVKEIVVILVDQILLRPETHLYFI